MEAGAVHTLEILDAMDQMRTHIECKVDVVEAHGINGNCNSVGKVCTELFYNFRCWEKTKEKRNKENVETNTSFSRLERHWGNSKHMVQKKKIWTSIKVVEPFHKIAWKRLAYIYIIKKQKTNK